MDKWPVHEALVHIIKNDMRQSEISMMAEVIRLTCFEEGHDQICDAWVERLRRHDQPEDYLGIPAFLNEQKTALSQLLQVKVWPKDCLALIESKASLKQLFHVKGWPIHKTLLHLITHLAAPLEMALLGKIIHRSDFSKGRKKVLRALEAKLTLYKQAGGSPEKVIEPTKQKEPVKATALA